jgi:CheY-like chemotaxis protein
MGIAAVFASPTVKGCRPCCRISIPFKQALWCGGGASAFGDRIFQPSRSHVFGRAVVAPTSDGMDRRPHIVVVEDETTERRLLVDYLTRQNFRVSGADGGTALRKLVERDMPALVLLDVGLPGEDGFALARWLREKRCPHWHRCESVEMSPIAALISLARLGYDVSWPGYASSSQTPSAPSCAARP